MIEARFQIKGSLLNKSRGRIVYGKILEGTVRTGQTATIHFESRSISLYVAEVDFLDRLLSGESFIALCFQCSNDADQLFFEATEVPEQIIQLVFTSSD